MARISALKIVFHCKHAVLVPQEGALAANVMNIKKGSLVNLEDLNGQQKGVYIVESLMLKHTDSAYIEVRVNPRP